MKEAKYYRKLGNNKIRCELCPHFCKISEGEISICRSRKNIGGKLVAINFGETISVSIDPMEKKPLFHFYPGKKIISVGSNSCNFSCKFCQNYYSSQKSCSTTRITSNKLLEICQKYDINFVAFTYTEPTTWFEFVLESAKYLQKKNVKIVLVTNGFINPKPLQELLPHVDAMNIDLKSMNDNFYINICNGKLKPILQTIKTVSKSCHLEITNLVITDENDDEKQISKLVDFIAEIDPNIPLHLSRYYPIYKMENPPTSIKTLQKAKEIADQKLNFVYLGNVIFEQHTICPKCGEIAIRRDFKVADQSGKCLNCGHQIYGEF